MSLPDPSGAPAPPAAVDERLDWAIDGLCSSAPELSARRTITRPQKLGLAVASGLVLIGLLLDATLTAVVLMGFVLAIYVATIVLRLELIRRGWQGGGKIVVTDA